MMAVMQRGFATLVSPNLASGIDPGRHDRQLWPMDFPQRKFENVLLPVVRVADWTWVLSGRVGAEAELGGDAGPGSRTRWLRRRGCAAGSPPSARMITRPIPPRKAASHPSRSDGSTRRPDRPDTPSIPAHARAAEGRLRGAARRAPGNSRSARAGGHHTAGRAGAANPARPGSASAGGGPEQQSLRRGPQVPGCGSGPRRPRRLDAFAPQPLLVHHPIA